MSRINVLWIIDHVCYDGSLHGGGRLYWNIVPRFDPKRVRVVPCLLRASDEVRELFKNAEAPIRILDKGKFDPSTVSTILRLIRDEDIHVMHLHCYGAATFGRLAGLISGVPCIIHDYDTAVYFPYPWYLWLADRLLSPLTRRAIAASPMVRDYFIERRGVPSSKIMTAFHAVPAEKYAPVSPDQVIAARSALGIDPSAAVIGTVTKLGPQRGNKYLLEAAARVLDSRPDAMFVINYKPTIYHRAPDARYVDPLAADQEDRISDLEAKATELGIQDSVRFVEEEDDVAAVMRAFDLFVAPFLSARFSSVNLLEAMAMGKPVIASDLGEQKEIIEGGDGGFLVKPGDVGGLAERILNVVSDAEGRGRLGRAARKTAEHHSVDAYVRRLESLYQELTAAPAGVGQGVPKEGPAQ